MGSQEGRRGRPPLEGGVGGRGEQYVTWYFVQLRIAREEDCEYTH
jgi:hypothetical protein